MVRRQQTFSARIDFHGEAVEPDPDELRKFDKRVNDWLEKHADIGAEVTRHMSTVFVPTDSSKDSRSFNGDSLTITVMVEYLPKPDDR